MSNSTIASLNNLIVPNVYPEDIAYIVHDPSGTPVDRKIELAVLAYATPQNFNQQSSDYTLIISDAGKLVSLDSSGSVSLTVPVEADVAFPVGTRIDGMQLGTGQVSIVGGSGVTINAYPGLLTAGQYAGFTLVKNGADSWWAFGALSA